MIELGLVNIGEHNNAMFMDGNSAALYLQLVSLGFRHTMEINNGFNTNRF